VFNQFQGTHLTLSLEMYQLKEKEVRYVVHVVLPEAIVTNPEKLELDENGQHQGTNVT
jgi:hypothetical protein